MRLKPAKPVSKHGNPTITLSGPARCLVAAGLRDAVTRMASIDHAVAAVAAGRHMLTAPRRQSRRPGPRPARWRVPALPA